MPQKLPQEVDWLSDQEQQVWFDKFKSPESEGIKFNKFQELLQSTLYQYFARNIANGDISLEKSKFTYQQEITLFKNFDTKNDHLLDRDEFSNLCQHWLHKTFNPSRALVIVDVQNDFIDGSLALINGPASQDGVEVIPVINDLLTSCTFKAVVYTQDWHPIDHIGFHENLHLRKYSLKSNPVSTTNGDKRNDENVNTKVDKSIERSDSTGLKLKKLQTNVKLFDTVLFNDGKMEQKLWPIHCVQNSWGAELHPKLNIIPNSIRILKGTLSNVDAYSAFWDNMKLNETGLRQELLDRKVDEVYFCGLALDYCVSASALDSVKAGFTTYVIEDACRGIDEMEIERRKLEMSNCGIFVVNSKLVKNHKDIKYVQLEMNVCFRKALNANRG